MPVIASIPSPSSDALHIGPLSIHAYGLMIALGVIAAVWLLGRRFEAARRRHARDRQLDRRVGGDRRRDRLPAVPRRHRLGAVRGRLVRRRQIWQGGLGIPGGILFGTLAAGVGVPSAAASPPPSASASRHRRCRSPRPSVDGATGGTRSCSASPPRCRGPCEIDRQDHLARVTRPAPRSTRRSSTSRCGTWRCAGSCCGSTTGSSSARAACSAIYVVGYAVGRFWVEGLRIDFAHTTGGLRLNQWVAMV